MSPGPALPSPAAHGAVHDPRDPTQNAYFGSPPPQQLGYGSPPPQGYYGGPGPMPGPMMMQPGGTYYGPPQPGGPGGYGPQGQWAAAPGGYGPPQGGGMYYQDRGYYERRDGKEGICAGIFGALACCCCLDALLFF